LQNFRHPLRGERIGGVTFDACHNEAGLDAFALWAQRQAPQADLLVALSGRDPKLLEPFCGQNRNWFCVAARHPKATNSSVLARWLNQRGEKVEALNRDTAFQLLRSRSTGPQDSLLAFGSIYAMGPLRDRLEKDES
jgi:folylpolyglutamate synthase/dihydropteroate synthase